ncbi:putative ABC transporter, ATP-binding protein [Desulfamplus magnetovallimortis]|uniref:Putative ABC transporter, ATP-binding protein n=1 Tax=Desulfamplus magnetovallimortis TaxID=1246637 RepID=A0A1W1H6J4_9BACT|nr:ABC transporter ATP-binding protein [Desulfamplus magnetovallimortis]SLM28103.1 putative ABC transporter, ATP-binding protein [Desulfamplus magnetovallimortis]
MMKDSGGIPVLEVKDLAISYKTRKGSVPAVRGVNFSVGQGETVGLVGESGCGKSTIAFGILDFLGTNGYVAGGSIKFMGQELVGKPREELRKIRGNNISMVYQDPMQALNPSLTIGTQLAEVLTTHHKEIHREDAWDRSIAMLERVYMPDAMNVMERYPHMISGGQQQRVVIAMGMLNNPSLLIMDEPTTALDVTVEAAVLDLVDDLKKDFNTGIIFITHNLGVVARVSDHLCVMYAGEMVERASIQTIFDNPAHPYTRGLLSCIPRLTDDLSYSRLWSIRGRVPHPSERDAVRCVFSPRCDWMEKHKMHDKCTKMHPELVDVGEFHQSRCFMGATTLEYSMTDYARGNRKILEDAADEADKSEAASSDSASEIDTDATGADNSSSDSNIAKVKSLKVYYEQKAGTLKGLFGMEEKQYVKAVDDVSLNVPKGAVLGVVGESGCGKSSLVKGLVGLEKISGGDAELMGFDITLPVAKRSERLIRELQMVFQNPDSTLNPSFTVGQQIARPIKRFKTVPDRDIPAEVERLLRAVKLDTYYYSRYPRQLSGGEKQRVGIARALASQPSMVICDEPVSALDVSVQAAVLNLLNEIKDELGTTLIFIAHDLSVVRFISDFIAVMYLGQIVEFGSVRRIYPPPYHPYTEALLSAVPVPDPVASRRKFIRLSGDVPSAMNPPSGCRFHTRCPRRSMLPDNGKICEEQAPPWQKGVGTHRIMCHIPIDELGRMEAVLPLGKGYDI